jgi:hypothetical protein
MEQEKYITKEYFNKRFQEFKSDFHVFTQVLQGNIEAYYLGESSRQNGALQENFRSDLQVALDQVKSVTDKTNDHERRICKIEKAVL